ncbi:prepilin peptidase [Mixta calida]|uniref:Prepilin leader peptidase/N-methyltransferase n=1 Tax=Mixta calida TaxID=665913 RepID=A0ABM6RYW2_9GAMM|nr:A24 family peptidase [Mixta calida]AUY23829.1 prepilin peptidase [Mixta calida]KAF0858849.1 hypothetical protein Y888_14200 [Mixta calida B021323]MDU5770539.1 A24 family peptidase [Mixta calida]MDU5829163.1 A24 family peptidase [Mixta calida]MDU6416581.1 A24 family peptidase [Mixta calida]
MMVILIFGLAGLVTGSFLCLAADRYRPELTERQWLQRLFFPSSRCAVCRQRLQPGDLIPLYSWMRWHRRCRYCRHKLPWRLPAVEVLASLLFCLSAWRVPSPAALMFTLLLSAALLLLSLIDEQYLILPDILTLPLLWLGLLYHLLLNEEKLPTAVCGALLGWLSLWLLYWLFWLFRQREGLGYGDMKLFAALGAWCGWQALPAIATFAALGGVLLFWHGGIKKGGAGADRQLPFGPCLSLAGWAVFVWHSQEANVSFLL